MTKHFKEDKRTKEEIKDPKGKNVFDNTAEDPLAAENKAEQATDDGSQKVFTPEGKENDPYYNRPIPRATEIVKEEKKYGIPAGGISSAPTSVVDPEAAVEVREDEAYLVTGQSNPDLPGTAADGFQPRAGGEPPAKPMEAKDKGELAQDHENQNKALRGNYENKSE